MRFANVTALILGTLAVTSHTVKAQAPSFDDWTFFAKESDGTRTCYIVTKASQDEQARFVSIASIRGGDGLLMIIGGKGWNRREDAEKPVITLKFFIKDLEEYSRSFVGQNNGGTVIISLGSTESRWVRTYIRTATSMHISPRRESAHISRFREERNSNQPAVKSNFSELEPN